MADLDIAAIKARADAATEGPWEARGNEIVLLLPDVGDGPAIKSVGSFWGWQPPGDPIGVRCNANAEFIAHARTDIPALIAALDAKTAECEALAAKVATVRGLCEKSLADKDSFLHGILKAEAMVKALGEQP